MPRHPILRHGQRPLIQFPGGPDALGQTGQPPPSRWRPTRVARSGAGRRPDPTAPRRQIPSARSASFVGSPGGRGWRPQGQATRIPDRDRRSDARPTEAGARRRCISRSRSPRRPTRRRCGWPQGPRRRPCAVRHARSRRVGTRPRPCRPPAPVQERRCSTGDEHPPDLPRGGQQRRTQRIEFGLDAQQRDQRAPMRSERAVRLAPTRSRPCSRPRSSGTGAPSRDGALSAQPPRVSGARHRPARQTSVREQPRRAVPRLIGRAAHWYDLADDASSGHEHRCVDDDRVDAVQAAKDRRVARHDTAAGQHPAELARVGLAAEFGRPRRADRERSGRPRRPPAAAATPPAASTVTVPIRWA